MRSIGGVLLSGVASVLVAAASAAAVDAYRPWAVMWVAGTTVAAVAAALLAAPPARRRRWATAAAVAAAAVAALTLALLQRPVSADPRAEAAGTQPERWRVGGGGAALGVHEHRAGAGAGPVSGRAAPIVYLHGGPGVPDPAGAAAMEELAARGHHTVAYDQLGSGDSDRLEDPADYTVRRHVEDLERLRQRLGSPQLVLVGSSWGVDLAAAYAARHPEAVAAVVAVSAAPLDGARRSGRDAPSVPLRLRAYAVFATLNPGLARSFVPDREADRAAGRLLHADAPGCRSGDGQLPQGVGLLANLRTNLDLLRNPVDLADAAGNAWPVLVIRGACDETHTSAAVALAEAGAAAGGASTACIADSGHRVAADAPVELVDEIDAFLRKPPQPGAAVDVEALRSCVR